jgi:hypothetical protein
MARLTYPAMIVMEVTFGTNYHRRLLEKGT